MRSAILIMMIATNFVLAVNLFEATRKNWGKSSHHLAGIAFVYSYFLVFFTVCSTVFFNLVLLNFNDNNFIAGIQLNIFILAHLVATRYGMKKFIL